MIFPIKLYFNIFKKQLAFAKKRDIHHLHIRTYTTYIYVHTPPTYTYIHHLHIPPTYTTYIYVHTLPTYTTYIHHLHTWQKINIAMFLVQDFYFFRHTIRIFIFCWDWMIMTENGVILVEKEMHANQKQCAQPVK